MGGTGGGVIRALKLSGLKSCATKIEHKVLVTSDDGLRARGCLRRAHRSDLAKSQKPVLVQVYASEASPWVSRSPGQRSWPPG